MSIFNLKKLEKVRSNQIFTNNQRDYSWGDFKKNIISISNRIMKIDSENVIIFTDESDDFTLLFLSALYAGKNIIIPGIKPSNNEIPILSNDDDISEIDIKGKYSSDGFINKLDVKNQQIILQTSGSTGKSKDIIKKLENIENEVIILSKQWANEIEKTTFYSTVSHQHFYGLLFNILLPLCTNNVIYSKRLHYPESIYTIMDSKCCIISSPAFYKRVSSLSERTNINPKNITLFSSGGFLPQATATTCKEFFGTPIIEIYGSTETGGIAYKTSTVDLGWIPFPCVSFKKNSNDTHNVLSSYIPEKDGFELSDHLEFNKDNTFYLFGRIDSVVKVEEKRVALNDIENRLLDTGLVTDSVVLLVKDNREYIVAAIELNTKGSEKFKSFEKIEINKFFRNYLKDFFHGTVLPKKWRYIKKLPRNSQGKISKKLTMSLFSSAEDVEIISFDKTDNNLTYIINHPENYKYFEGHFPELKLLPAVAQIDWIMNQTEKELHIKPSIINMPRLKFTNPILPETKIKVSINFDKDKNTIQFKYSSEDLGKLYSSGKIFLEGSYDV